MEIEHIEALAEKYLKMLDDYDDYLEGMPYVQVARLFLVSDNSHPLSFLSWLKKEIERSER